ncbi:VIR protein [Plasmodium vivax]|uniref:VIR protein n=1 Tax=Plasmodium vivax TaxID=5855 RepID=A0A1G4EA67_PLAVI|nr:VIR protein [Plasmodium vivax]
MAGQDFWTSLTDFVFSFSDELNSQRFYDQLDDLEGYIPYLSKCEYFNSFDKNKRAKKICARVLKYLETDKISINKNDDYDICMLLNFWVYSKLFDILQNKGEKNVHIAYGELQLLWDGIIDYKLKKHENQTCRPLPDLVLYNDWKERKELYEYCVDYPAISKSAVGYNERCREFYKYVESKKPLYKHFKEHCPSDEKKKCPEFYNQCLQYDPEKVLPDLECSDEIMQERAAAASSALQKTKEHLGSETESRGRSVGMVSDGAQNLNGNPQNVRMYGNVLLGVVATSMTSGALYRFTPLGGMIRNGLGWNNNNMRNFNAGDFRLYDYASEPFNPYPGEEHYIGYHPA